MEISYSKDSFDRFGDDLCQVILSYLAFNEKFKYECVSKQWRQLIFNNEFCIHFYDFEDLEEYKYKKLIFDNLEIILKKCQFIKEIHYESYECEESVAKTIRLITFYTRFIEKFRLNSMKYFDSKSEILSESLNKFSEKFGNKLKLLKVVGLSPQLVSRILTKAINLRKVHFEDLSVVIDTNNDNYLNKLQSIKFTKYSDQDFQLFADKYCKQLQNISYISMNGLCRINVMLNEFSRFERLAKLHLRTWIAKDVFIDEDIKQLGQRCLHLKNLTFDITGYNPFKHEVFAIFSQFKSLTQFYLIITVDSNYGSIKLLSKLENLTHLWLNLKTEEYCLVGIDKALPQLQLLSLQTPLSNKYSLISDHSLYDLSNLKNLKTFKLIEVKFNENSLISFIDNCIELRYVYCISHLLCSRAFIQNFTECAKRKPDVIIEMNVNKHPKHRFLWTLMQSLPNNLLINK